jgi:hypothetical protein
MDREKLQGTKIYLFVTGVFEDEFDNCGPLRKWQTMMSFINLAKPYTDKLRQSSEPDKKEQQPIQTPADSLPKKQNLGEAYLSVVMSFLENRVDLFSQKNINEELLRRARTEEMKFLASLQEEIKSGAGLGDLLEHHNETDFAFISAYRDWKNYDVKNLARELHDLGYPFIKIEGDGSPPEDSFFLINKAEPADHFFFDLEVLGRKYSQNIILTVLEGQIPYFYDCKTGEKEYAKNNSLQALKDSVENYFSRIKGRSISFHDLKLNLHPNYGPNALSPIRLGYPALIVLGARKRLRDYRGSF